MEWSTAFPLKSGKYIVETITTMGNIHKIYSHYNAESGNWSFNNQKFNRYLKE